MSLFLRVSALALFVCAASLAQSNFGAIRGVVSDSSGAVVPNARVEIIDQGTNARLALTSGPDGIYSAPSLRPVTYTVTVEAPGFRKTVVEGVKVDTAKLQTVDVVLTPGEVSTTVQITAEAPLLQTYTGAVTNTVDTRTITDAPLNGRNTIELALMLPGAAGSAGTEISETFTNDPTPGRELSINGGRMGSTQFLADGANVTSLALSRMSISFTPDTIQEFSVQQANYSAQYAQAGAIVQQTTKSGSNELRGTAYWFHRQKALTATPFAATRQSVLNFDARPPLRRQQLGFTVGGPVVLPKVYKGKDRTFFFVSYEPTRQLASNPTASYLRMPTEDEIKGDFSKTQVYFRDNRGVITTQPTALLYRQFDRRSDGTLTLIPNPRFNAALPASVTNSRFLYGGSNGPAFELFNPNDPDPARRGRVLVDASGRSYVNPVAARIARDFFPAPNVTNPAEVAELLGANYAYFRRTMYSDDRYTFRLDHRVNDRHIVYGRYTFQPQYGNRFERDVIQHGLISDANKSRQLLGVWTWTPGATMFNELRLNYVFGDFGRNFPEPLLNKDYTTEYLDIGGPGKGAVNLLGYGMPRFYDGGALKAAAGQTSGAGIASAGFNSPQDVGKNREHSFSLTDDYSWVRGAWSMKMGFSASVLMLNQASLGVGSLAGGRYSWEANFLGEKNCNTNPVGGNYPDCSGAVLGGDKFASFLIGVPFWTQVQTENLSIPYYYRWKNFGGYWQNDFRVSPNLTLNLGLRYQYQSPRWEKFNRQGQLNLDRMEPSTMLFDANNNLIRDANGNPFPAPVFEYAGFKGRSRYITPPQKDVFEPRFGFAWVPGFDWNSRRRMVVRGGYGITHGSLMGNDREPIPNIGSQTFTQYRSLSYVLGSNDWSPPSNSATCGLARCGEIDVPMQLGYNNPVLASDPKMFNLPPDGEIRPGDAADLSSSRGRPRQDVRYQATGVVGDKNFRMPTVQNYSLLMQYEFMTGTVLTTGYQGSRGTHLFGAPLNLNRVDPFTGALPYPGFAGRFSNAIYLLDPTNAASTYHAWIAEIERRFGAGLQFRANYTWSRNIDDNSGGVKFPIPNNSFANPSFSVPLTRAQNPYDSRSERAPAASDTPHIFNLMAFYELPVGPGKRFLNGGAWYRHAMGGWQISGLGRIRSGYPITATLGQNNSLDTGLPGGSLRPDLVAGVPLINPDWTPANAQFTNYVNPRAFSWPEPGRYGNAARNYTSARLPWVQTLDVSVFKRIRPFGESRRHFEIRVEAFNVLNHRVFESNINNTSLISTGGQNALLTGSSPFQVPVAGRVENRNRNLTAPGVWDAIINKSTGMPVDQAIAALPGPGTGGVGCPSNAAELTQQTAALSPACLARSLSLNANFYRLNQNTVASRIIQLGLKFYF